MASSVSGFLATTSSPSPLAARAAYIHVPFCRHRCGYCNFTLVARRDDLIDAYLRAIERELSWLDGPHEVDTLFFGGGTPTHLPPPSLARLCAIVRKQFPLAANHEFSVEANPLDLTAERIAVLVEHGVNRVSLGVQSIDDAKLATLERDHRRPDIEATLDRCRAAFPSVAVDLIFGVPGETRDVWLDDLRFVTSAAVDHVSTYGLTFEQGTAFWTRRRQGALSPVDEHSEAEFYETAIDRLTAAGFEHYEVSNFARAGHRCRHNETYWLGGSYFAAGPGAARYLSGRREINHRSTTTYLKRVLAGESPVAEAESLLPEDAARERLVFALRRMEGLDRHEFLRWTGFDIEVLLGPPLRRFVEQALLTWDGPRLRLTRAGLLVSDSLWPEFLRG